MEKRQTGGNKKQSRSQNAEKRAINTEQELEQAKVRFNQAPIFFCLGRGGGGGGASGTIAHRAKTSGRQKCYDFQKMCAIAGVDYQDNLPGICISKTEKIVDNIIDTSIE